MKLPTIALATSLFSGVASADSSRLDFTFENAQTVLKAALNRAALREPLALKGCLKGDSEKRTVCTYTIGKILVVMLQSEKGGSDVTGMTMICSAQSSVDSVNCLIGYGAGMMAATKDQPTDARGSIIKVLLQGLPLGNEARITTDERRYTLQKSMGIWFSIEAADSAE